MYVMYERTRTSLVKSRFVLSRKHTKKTAAVPPVPAHRGSIVDSTVPVARGGGEREKGMPWCSAGLGTLYPPPLGARRYTRRGENEQHGARPLPGRREGRRAVLEEHETHHGEKALGRGRRLVRVGGSRCGGVGTRGGVVRV